MSDASGIARVHVDTWRTTYRGLVSDECLDKLSYDRSEQTVRRRIGEPGARSFTYVAEDEAGEIVGFAIGGPNRERETAHEGELWAIYVAEAHQREGIGGALVRAVAQRLVQTGARAMVVWVLRRAVIGYSTSGWVGRSSRRAKRPSSERSTTRSHMGGTM